MTSTFQEKPPETKANELPQIVRNQIDLYSPLETLHTLAFRLGNYNSEVTYRRVERADFVATVARNIQGQLPQGSAKVVDRFSTVLSLATDASTQREETKDQKKQSV